MSENRRAVDCENPYVEDYLSTNEGIRLAPRTVRTYRTMLVGYVRYLREQEITVMEAELTDVIDFVEHCVRRGNRESTISGKLTAIGQLYRHIKLRMDTDASPRVNPIEIETIDVGRYRTPPPVKREALSRDEVRRLFDAMDCYRDRLLAVTAIETGLRNSDLRELRLQDIEYEELAVHVRDPKGSIPYDVPISEELAFELEWWVENQRNGFATAASSQYIFPSQQSDRLETNGSLNQIIKSAAERAGIQCIVGTSKVNSEPSGESGPYTRTMNWHRVTPHTLRHTYLTLLKDAGVPLSYRQLVANHTNPETTRNYTHGGDDVFEVIRDKFEPPR